MRLELTSKTNLAARALQFLVLNGDGQPLKGSLLADRLGTTIHYLPQVMKALVVEGWVASEPGPTGGYRSTEAGAEASMLALIEAVEGPFADGRCVLREAPCPAVESCSLHTAWSRARNALIEELRRTPVVDQGGRSRPGHDSSKGDSK